METLSPPLAFCEGNQSITHGISLHKTNNSELRWFLWTSFWTFVLIANVLRRHDNDDICCNHQMLRSLCLACSLFMMTSPCGNISALLAFVSGIHQSPMNSPNRGLWHGALMFSLIGSWTNGWVNNRDVGDLKRYRTLYDVIVIWGRVEHRYVSRLDHHCSGNGLAIVRCQAIVCIKVGWLLIRPLGTIGWNLNQNTSFIQLLFSHNLPARVYRVC